MIQFETCCICPFTLFCPLWHEFTSDVSVQNLSSLHERTGSSLGPFPGVYILISYTNFYVTSHSSLISYVTRLSLSIGLPFFFINLEL